MTQLDGYTVNSVGYHWQRARSSAGQHRKSACMARWCSMIHLLLCSLGYLFTFPLTRPLASFPNRLVASLAHLLSHSLSNSFARLNTSSMHLVSNRIVRTSKRWCVSFDISWLVFLSEQIQVTLHHGVTSPLPPLLQVSHLHNNLLALIDHY